MESTAKMKMKFEHALYRYLVLALYFTFAISIVRGSTVSGNVKVNGSPFTGNMVVQLSYPATSGSYINLPLPSAPISVSNGTFASLKLDGNDILLPRGTYYAFNFYDLYGNLVSRLNYKITGTTFDIGSAIPTPILTNNVNFLDLLGIRNFSALNMTITNQIQMGTGTIINQGGISNAENIMGLYFSQAYNIQNPSSTTCGIQEAENALPSIGGTIWVQPGVCNTSTTINITKPGVVIRGMGQGGYSNNALSATIFPTTLNITAPGIPLVSASPAAGTTISGLTLRDLALTGASGSGDLLQLGNASSTTAFLRNVEIDGVWASGKASAVSVVGNVDGLRIHNSTLSNNTTSGVNLNAGAGYVIDNVDLDEVTTEYNGLDGVTINGAAVRKVRAHGLNANHNAAYGADVVAGSTSAQFTAYQSTFTSNATKGVMIAAGSGHVVEASTIASNTGYGVDITTAGAASTQILSLKDDTFIPANGTYDIHNASTAYVLLYPQVTQAAVTNGTFNYLIAQTTTTAVDYYFSFTGCTLTVGGNSVNCTATELFSNVTPTTPDQIDTNYFISCTTNTGELWGSSTGVNFISTNGFSYVENVDRYNGVIATVTPTVWCHAHHN